MAKRKAMPKYLTLEQVNRLHGLIRMQGFNTVSLSMILREPQPTVASVLNGSKRTPAVRAKIAAFLERGEAELFGEDEEIGRQEACAPEAVNE